MTIDIDAIRKLADAADPGPWTAHPDGLVWSTLIGDPVSGSTEQPNAEFIAAARTHVPQLCAEIEQLRGERDKVVRERDSLARRLGVRYEELEKARAQVADLADKLHKAQQENASHTKAGTAWANEVDGLKRDLSLAVEDRNKMKAKLDGPCGSCHPCVNYADETWRAAGRKPPHVITWDDTREAMERVAHLADQYEVAGNAETAQRIRKALTIPTLDELLDAADQAEVAR